MLAWLSAADTNRPLAYVGVFIFVVAGWLVSMCLHEFAHAFTAWRYGDHDVAVRGYLTLNPLKYSSPLMSIALPLLFIAIGGHRPARRCGLCAHVVDDTVAAHDRQPCRAIANAALAVVSAGADCGYSPTPDHLVFWAGMAFLGFLQVTAVVLNLLPIPGLDGYGALEPHLSPKTQRALAPAKQLGFFILLILLIAPGLNQWFWDIVLWFFDFSGVPRGLVGVGSALTRFWSAWF